MTTTPYSISRWNFLRRSVNFSFVLEVLRDDRKVFSFQFSVSSYLFICRMITSGVTRIYETLAKKKSEAFFLLEEKKERGLNSKLIEKMFFIVNVWDRAMTNNIFCSKDRMSFFKKWKPISSYLYKTFSLSLRKFLVLKKKDKKTCKNKTANFNLKKLTGKIKI